MELKLMKTSKLLELDLIIGDLIKEFGEVGIRQIQQKVFDEINFRYMR